MRVLHVLAPGRRGGVESVVAMLAEAQRSDGVHVAAIISPRESTSHPFIGRLEGLGIPLTRIVAGARAYVHEYRSLRELIARLRPSILHSHGYHADLVAGIAAHRSNVPAVSTVHGFTGVPLRNLVYERLQLMALKRADAVMAVSQALVARLANAGIAREKIYLVPNGFVPAGPQIPRAAARKKLDLPEEALVAGWVGRLSREKGADVMLESLAQTNSEWRLSMIGDGPERERLSRQVARLGVAHRVYWHGEVENAGSLFKAFDAFVLSSRTEGTPITLFEAMHACTPIIATRVGGVPGVVTSSHAILVEPDRPPMIAAALSAIRNDQDASELRATTARERVIEQFGVERWLSNIDAVYDRVERS